MHRYKGKLIRSLLIIGLALSSEVPAIDGDYSNPYANGEGQGEQSDRGSIEWDGSASYGGMDADLPGVTYVGAGMLLIGVLVGIRTIKRGKRHA